MCLYLIHTRVIEIGYCFMFYLWEIYSEALLGGNRLCCGRLFILPVTKATDPRFSRWEVNDKIPPEHRPRTDTHERNLLSASSQMRV